jgi:two-component system, NarL family, sensor histidine kinase DegS
MINITIRNTKRNFIIYNPHFWAITLITLLLVFIYSAWPWSHWKMDYGIWQHFPWLSSFYGLSTIEITNHIVGTLLLIPIIYAALVFSWQGALVVCLVSFARVLPIILGVWSISSLMVNIAALLLPLLLSSITTIELQWRRKERKVFLEREEERKLYISKVFEAQENERKRIAMNIHDDTIQTLLAIANSAESMVRSNSTDIALVKSKSALIRDTTLSAADNMRKITFELRPSILDNLGLIPALRWLVDRMSVENNINAQIIVNGEERKLPPQTEVLIFRVVQEALNNVKRHSRASELDVNLEFNSEKLKITIQDNGQGFSPQKEVSNYASKGKLGLVGMQERIGYLGGLFKIHSNPGKGTQILIDVKC